MNIMMKNAVISPQKQQSVKENMAKNNQPPKQKTPKPKLQNQKVSMFIGVILRYDPEANMLWV